MRTLAQLEGSPLNVAVPGIRSKDDETAEDNTCVEVIRYVEAAINVIVTDLNYTRVKELEEENKSMRCQLRQANEYKKNLPEGGFCSQTYLFVLSADSKYYLP